MRLLTQQVLVYDILTLNMPPHRLVSIRGFKPETDVVTSTAALTLALSVSILCYRFSFVKWTHGLAE